MTVDSAPRWCARLIADFSAADTRAKTLAAALTRGRVNWKPRPDAWSIGQCLQHLVIGNELYIDAIEAAMTRNLTVTGPVDEIAIGAPSRWFIRSYIEPSPQTKRAKAPKQIVPSATIDENVLDRFLEGNQRIRAIVRRASDYDVNRIRFRNPFVPVIRFTVGTGFELLARHEERHLLQAERVRQAPDFPVA
jgi:hypothetical protein